MSFDLIAWKAPAVTDEDEAAALLEPYYKTGDTSRFEASEDVAAFCDELSAQYPEATGPVAATRGQPNQWGLDFDRSDRLVVLSMSWSVPGDVLDDIVARARQRSLVLYDPQGPTLHSPEQPLLPQPPENVAGQVATGLFAALIGVAIAVAGFYMPWRLIGLPMIVVGGFVTVVSLSVLWVAFLPERRKD